MSTSEPQPANNLTLGQLAELDELTNQTCETCNTFFKKLSHYNRHMREKHTQFRDYVCKEQTCLKSFKRGSHLKRHMISHTNVKNYKCKQCIMSFGYKHHLDRHVKIIHLSERLQCLECNLKFIKKKAYHKHLSKNHQKQSQNNGHCNKTQIANEEDKIIDHCTNTKIGLDESKREQIYQSSSSSEEDMAKTERQLFRCLYQNCLSAFYDVYDLQRHIDCIHQQVDS